MDRACRRQETIEKWMQILVGSHEGKRTLGILMPR
jgi:hypothetical protein